MVVSKRVIKELQQMSKELRRIRQALLLMVLSSLLIVLIFSTSTALTSYINARPNNYQKLTNKLGTPIRLRDTAINPSSSFNLINYREATTPDFGDAPAAYGDASAAILTGLSLGSDVDGEDAPLYTVAADGDDLSGLDDEDGLYVVGGGRYHRLGRAGESFLMVVAARVPDGRGLVYCWLDFDRSGLFDTDEAIIAGAPVARSNGAITHFQTIPADAISGVSYLRCRLTDAETGGDSPIGAAGRGEVEDYLVIIEGVDPVLTSSLGSTVFLDADNDGVHEAGEPGIPGVTVELHAAGPDGEMGGDDDTLLSSAATDAEGNYHFDELLPGKYFVVIPTPPVDALKSSDPTDVTDNQIDGDDNGIQPAGTGTAIHSPVILLALGGEPTGAHESAAGGSLDDVFDADGDMTVDFGLVDVEPFPATNTPTPTAMPLPETPTATPSPSSSPTATPTPSPSPSATPTTAPTTSPG